MNRSSFVLKNNPTFNLNIDLYGELGSTSGPQSSGFVVTLPRANFACMFDNYLWKIYVYHRTTFSNVKDQDLCATINSSKNKYLQNQKQSLKYLCNNNLIGFLQKPHKVISDTTRRDPYNRLTFYPNREVRNFH